ncbi:hypothetical protein AAHA92_17152 [Salvia divinorum]|uniref:Uncharacterized protein n=1 Tax=Salvia divinorum TaxID=28513 RepID=A0ABD1GY03_SALDI
MRRFRADPLPLGRHRALPQKVVVGRRGVTDGCWAAYLSRNGASLSTLRAVISGLVVGLVGSRSNLQAEKWTAGRAETALGPRIRPSAWLPLRVLGLGSKGPLYLFL